MCVKFVNPLFVKMCIFQNFFFKLAFYSNNLFYFSINLKICKYPLLYKLICLFLYDLCVLPHRLENALWSDHSRILLLKVMRDKIFNKKLNNFY